MARDRIESRSSVRDDEATEGMVGEEEEAFDQKANARTSLAQARLQFRRLSDDTNGGDSRAAAAEGVAGGGQRIPHADKIQAAFGEQHDVSAISAHVGGKAATAAEAMGAEAFTVGNQVGFNSSPDVHTAAHEAAHVFQQQQGVQLKGGVGQVGDAYEQHADAVADATVAGRSAAGLLQRMPAAGGSSEVVQHKKHEKHEKHEKKKDPKKEAEEAKEFESDGPAVVHALAGVFNEHYGADMRSYMPSRYHDALDKLVKAKFSTKLDGRKRLALYEEAWAVFRPFVVANDRFLGPDFQLDDHFAWLRRDLLFAEAGSRIQNTMVIEEDGKKKAIELPDDGHPREQAKVLHAQLPKLIDSMQTTVARAHKFLKGAVGEEKAAKVGMLKDALSLAQGWLLLNDEEFRKELSENKGFFKNVQNYAEFVKTIMEMAEASIMLTIELTGMLAKAVGVEEASEAVEWASKGIEGTFTAIVAGIEIVHGLATVFDSSKSSDERIEGGVEIGAGIGTLAAGSALGSLPVTGPYAMIKLAQALFSGAALGYEVGILKTTFKRLADEGKSISYQADKLVAAHQLAQEETDPDKRRAMATQEKVIKDQLVNTLDGFLGDCSDQGHGIGEVDWNSMQFYPGNIPIIQEKFAGVVMMRGSLKGGNVNVIALMVKLTLENIAWCFEHAQAIVKGSALSKHADDMDAMQADIDEKTKPKEE